MAEKGTGLPEISVLMPAYNAERYIEAAIRSLEEQTVEKWELIVVDDCSTDGTAQLLRRLAAEDPRIRPIFSAENRGAAASRNLALEQCRGSYVALLDADDLWRPRKLERQLALAEKTGGGHRLLLLCPDRRGGGEERRALCGARDDRFREDAGLQHPQLLHGVHKKGSHAPL